MMLFEIPGSVGFLSSVSTRKLYKFECALNLHQFFFLIYKSPRILKLSKNPAELEANPFLYSQNSVIMIPPDPVSNRKYDIVHVHCTDSELFLLDCFSAPGAGLLAGTVFSDFGRFW